VSPVFGIVAWRRRNHLRGQPLHSFQQFMKRNSKKKNKMEDTNVIKWLLLRLYLQYLREVPIDDT
jgi:hypothetical protein